MLRPLSLKNACRVSALYLLLTTHLHLQAVVISHVDLGSRLLVDLLSDFVGQRPSFPVLGILQGIPDAVVEIHSTKATFLGPAYPHRRSCEAADLMRPDDGEPTAFGAKGRTSVTGRTAAASCARCPRDRRRTATVGCAGRPKRERPRFPRLGLSGPPHPTLRYTPAVELISEAISLTRLTELSEQLVG
jgi:hypothetical protein